MIIWGSKAVEKVTQAGHFFCPNCRSDTTFARITVARYFTLYFAPLFETRKLGEYVRCGRCAAQLSPRVLAFSRADLQRALEPWKCPACGNQNPPNAGACLSCHKSRASIPPPIPTVPPAASSGPVESPPGPGAWTFANPPPSSSSKPPPPPRRGTYSPPPVPIPKGSNKRIWIVVGSCVVALIGLIVAVSIRNFKRNNYVGIPGGSELVAAQKSLINDRNGVALGNNSQAIQMASDLSEILADKRTILITGKDDPSRDLIHARFVVHCQFGRDRCAFLVHVPNITNYTAEAETAMAQVAFNEAQKLLRIANQPGMREVAVGLRGHDYYAVVLEGRYFPEMETPANAAREVSRHRFAEPELCRFFAP
jgi:hypothetical protein